MLSTGIVEAKTIVNQVTDEGEILIKSNSSLKKITKVSAKLAGSSPRFNPEVNEKISLSYIVAVEAIIVSRLKDTVILQA